jgi:hypothetical protein
MAAWRSACGCIARLYSPEDEMIGEPFDFPALPYPGLVILYEGEGWTVSAVSAVPNHPKSGAAERNEPAMVDVRVSRGGGIHDE